jgi:hypothetical protein
MGKNTKNLRKKNKNNTDKYKNRFIVIQPIKTETGT